MLSLFLFDFTTLNRSLLYPVAYAWIGAVIGQWGAIDKQHPHTIPVRLWETPNDDGKMSLGEWATPRLRCFQWSKRLFCHCEQQRLFFLFFEPLSQRDSRNHFRGHWRDQTWSENYAKISLTNGAGARGQKANNKENQVENLLEGLYYEMVLAPFYQNFMKSLDEHINELVEGTRDFQPP